MDHTKIVTADLDSPRREISVHGLGFVVRSLFGLLANYFCVRLQGEQSSFQL